MKNLGSKIQLLTILGLFVLLCVTMTAYGSGPAPGGKVHNQGPAVVGTVTIEPSAEDAGEGQRYLLWTFEGQCQGQEVSFPTPSRCGLAIYEEANEDTIRDFFVNCLPFPISDYISCAPEDADPNTPAKIIAFSQYNDDTVQEIKTAQIVVIFLVP